MADNQYRILLGTQLDTSDIVTQINEAERKIDPIKIKVDAETKELTKTIQDALKDLSSGTKNALTLDTTKLEASLNDVTSTIKEIKMAMGSLDSGSGMKSLVSSINSISTALDKASNKFDELVGDLKSLSGKDFSLNFGINLGGSNPIARQSAYGNKARNDTLPQLKQQMNALVKYYNDIYKDTADEFAALQKLVSGTKLSTGDFFQNFMFGKDSVASRMSGGSLSSQMQAYKQYIDMFKQAASLKGLDVSSVTSQFSKSADQLIQDAQDIQTGAKEMDKSFEKLKQIFGGGNNLNIEGISAQLDSIVVDLGEIRTALQGLSSGVSLDGITSSFNRLSNSIENLLANAEKVKGVLNSGFDVGKVNSDIDSIKASTVTRKGTTSEADEYLNSYLKHWNIKDEEDIKTVKAKFKAFSDVSSLGTGNEQYEAALDDLMNTLRQIGKVYKKADAEAQEVLNYLKKYKIEAPKDIYGAEFGDDWKDTKQKYKILRNEANDTADSAYMELGEKFPSYFPDDIWNEADQLKKIIEVYDKVGEASKGRYVDLDEEYGRTGLRNELLDIVDTMKQQSEAEQKVAQVSTQSANIVAQSENKKRQEYEETVQKIAQVDDAIQDFANRISNPTSTDFDSAAKEIQGYQEAIDNLEQYRAELASKANALGEELQIDKLDAFKNSLQSIGMDTDAIDNVTNRIQNLGVQIDTLDQKRTASDKKDILSVDISGVDEFGNAIKLTEQYNAVTGDLIKTVDRVSTVQQKAGTVTDSFVKQQKTAVSNLTNQINQMNRAANDPNASRPIKDTSHLDSLKSKYNEIISAIERMENASSDTFVDEQNNVRKLISEYKSLVSEYKNAENVSTKMKGTDFGSGLDIAKNDLEKFKAEAKDFPQITATVRELDKAIESVGDAASLNEFNDQLRVARSELAKVKSETTALNRSEKVGINVSGLESKIADIQRISPEIDKFETEIDGAKVSVQSLINDLKQVKTQGDFSVVNARFRAFKEAASAAGIAVTEVATKVKSINDIKIKISDTGFNGFEQEVKRAYLAAEELEGVYPELEAALKRLDVAMEGVYSADQVGDAKRLVAANEEYELSLKQVYSQLKLNQQAEEKAYKNELLSQKKAALSSEMEIWLKDNTRATKDFGEEIRRLQASLDGLDDKGVKLVGQQFKNVTKQAQAMGKTGLTAFDKLKSKAKEYMTYLSAAEIFMYAEQALREMFNTVKEIDTAMTGLYRVTDLTAAEYDTLFDNMISSAKEYGATLNDIINATTDWVRAGFDANTSLGLAEVTTMYQHISDLDYDTAAENLITAYNGFKDELNGAFSGDTVSAVEYIADIFNELDKQNCPLVV